MFLAAVKVFAIELDNIHHKKLFFWSFLLQGRFGAIIGLGLPNIYFAWRVARDFGYLAFKTVGAAVNIHRMSSAL